MGKKLNNAPVFYTVAQVQFNAVLDLEAYIPAIQSKMREARFPDYRKEFVQTFAFGPEQVALSAGGQALGQQQTRYLFGNIDGSSIFLMEANALSFQTTRYDTFESFSKLFLKGLSVFNEAVKLDFFERIGLRYLDAVCPNELIGESLETMLVPNVLGFSLHGQGRLQHSVSETSVATDAGQLVSRVIIRHGKIGLPMELGGPSAPKVDTRFTAREGLHAIIDTDAIAMHREAFELNKVSERLDALHKEIGKSFEATVTAHALNSWA